MFIQKKKKQKRESTGKERFENPGMKITVWKTPLNTNQLIEFEEFKGKVGDSIRQSDT